MRQYSIDYFRGSRYPLLGFALLGIVCFIFHKGFIYQQQYLVDLTGYMMMLISVIVFITTILKFRVMINFLTVDYGRIIIFESDSITVKRGKTSTKYLLKDARELVIVDETFNSKSFIRDLTYSKIIFNNSEVLIITSLTCSSKDIEKLFINKRVTVTRREKKLYEVIKYKADANNRIIQGL